MSRQKFASPHVLRAVVLAVFVALVTICVPGCAGDSATHSSSVDVPSQVADSLAGQTIASAVTTSTGPAAVGLGVLDSSSGSRDATFAVVTWVSVDSTQTRLLHGGKYWDVVNVVVRDSDGTTVYDNGETLSQLRGGGPVIEPIGAGTVFTRRSVFTLDRPGTYEVVGVARFSLGKPGLTGNTLTADQFDEYAVTTPPIALTVK